MNIKNELIAMIESARSSGHIVKSIRKQKYAPEAFYMSTVGGRQLGPVTCKGEVEELTRKYDEAVAYLNATKTTTPRIAA